MASLHRYGGFSKGGRRNALPTSFGCFSSPPNHPLTIYKPTILGVLHFKKPPVLQRQFQDVRVSKRVHLCFVWQAQDMCKVLQVHLEIFLACGAHRSSPCGFCVISPRSILDVSCLSSFFGSSALKKQGFPRRIRWKDLCVPAAAALVPVGSVSQHMCQ